MREKFRRITALIASGGRDNAVRFTKACLRGRRTHVDARANQRFEGPDADAVIKILIASTPIRDRAIFKASISNGVDPDGAINVRTLKLGLENSMAVGPIEGKVEFENVADSYFFKGSQGAWYGKPTRPWGSALQAKFGESFFGQSGPKAHSNDLNDTTARSALG